MEVKPVAAGMAGGAARIDVSLDEVVKAGVLLSSPRAGAAGRRPETVSLSSASKSFGRESGDGRDRVLPWRPSLSADRLCDLQTRGKRRAAAAAAAARQRSPKG